MSINSNDQELTERQRYWLDHLRACEASGKTMRTYAAEIGVGERAFYDAKKRLVKRGLLTLAARRRRDVGFARVEVVDAVSHGGDCRVQFPNGVTVTISATVAGGALSRILGAVATLG